MKRLITSVLVSLFVLVGLASPAYAADRYVKVDIFEPTTTSNRTLNVEYKVLSTVETDTFGVELFENGASKGTQEITHVYGDSGVFNVALPATGAYSYFVRATNHGNGNAVQNSKTVSVQITNAPQPIVTTVNTAGAGANAAVAGAAGAEVAGAGVVAGDEDGDGVVDDKAASTSKDTQDVLGAETKKGDVNKSTVWWYVGGGIAAALAGAYYFFGIRRANQQD